MNSWLVSKRPADVRWWACSVQAGLLSALAMALQGCGTHQGQVERWNLIDSRAPQPASSMVGAPHNSVVVVVYRDAGTGARASQPVNVYINGQYQASLVGSTYTEQTLCPGQHTLAVAFNDVLRRYDTAGMGRSIAIGHEPMQYFRVSEDAGGEAVVAPVVQASAQATVSSLRAQQAHTVSRVVRKGC